jgi:hypothetical protein
MQGQIRLYFWAAAIAAVCFLAMPLTPRAHAAGIAQLGILDTSGVNPNTGFEWAIGDEYRLTFISSARVNPTDNSFGSLDDIATWNAFAQSFADNSDQNLRGVSWMIIGSTTRVDAKDNTRTNPVVNGSGHPIMLIDGSTVIANNYADLWDGRIQNTITLTEKRGLTIRDADPPGFPYTGSLSDGTGLTASEVLRSVSGKQKIRQGQADDAVGWIDRNANGPPAKDNIPLSIYAMSEPLSVMVEGPTVTDEIPEVSSALLIGLAGLALLRRRR